MDVALEGGRIFPTHFFGQEIRPSLTTSKDGLKTVNKHYYQNDLTPFQ
jgi:hypothetical protein